LRRGVFKQPPKALLLKQGGDSLNAVEAFEQRWFSTRGGIRPTCAGGTTGTTPEAIACTAITSVPSSFEEGSWREIRTLE
jgi:hypothetical protein